MITLPFSYIRTGQITVRGKINGKSLDLILDTGASNTVIHTAKASELGLILTDTERLGGGVGGAEIQMFQLNDLEIEFGGKSFSAPKAHAMDLSHVLTVLKQFRARQVSCILGADILRKYKCVVDYGKKEVELHLPED